MIGKTTRAHWNKTLPFTLSAITFSYSTPNNEKTNQKPQEAVEAVSLHWGRAPRHNTMVLWQQEPISQSLGGLKAAMYTLYTLAGRGGNAQRFVAALGQLQFTMCSSLDSRRLRVHIQLGMAWECYSQSILPAHSPPLLECNPSTWEQPQPWGLIPIAVSSTWIKKFTPSTAARFQQTRPFSTLTRSSQALNYSQMTLPTIYPRLHASLKDTKKNISWSVSVCLIR